MDLKSRIRLAQKLHQAWQKRQGSPDVQHHSSLTRAWCNLLEAQRQVEMAEELGFVLCLPSLQSDYHWRLNELSRTASAQHASLVRPKSSMILKDWIQELEAIEEEFDDVMVDRKEGTLQVLTESIRLEGIELGEFAIVLHWNRLQHNGGSSCFEIIPLEPNPANDRENTFHPHVDHRQLCAGDASVPIDQALNDGRISEAFLLVRGVLSHYNPRSAYVPLSEWYGVRCDDCGGRTSSDDQCSCESCQSSRCEHCISSCRSCEGTRCHSCLTSCEGCEDDCCSGCLESLNGEWLCPSCRKDCSHCSKTFRATELNDRGLCPDCVPEPDSYPQHPLEKIHVSS